MILPENNLTHDSNDSNEPTSAVVIDQTEPAEEPSDDTTVITVVARHYYPFLVRLFWGATAIIFVVRFFVLCLWHVPVHLEAFNKRKAINSYTKNQEFFLALQLHEELCKAYPKSYTKEYAVDMANACFKCLSVNRKFLIKGLSYLRGRKIKEEEFEQLYQLIPKEIQDDYVTLFDAYYRKKYGIKTYYFILNDDKVKML